LESPPTPFGPTSRILSQLGLIHPRTMMIPTCRDDLCFRDFSDQALSRQKQPSDRRRILQGRPSHLFGVNHTRFD